MQGHDWKLIYRKAENLRMSVEFWKKLSSGRQEGLHWRFSKSFLWYNGKRHVKMWLAKHYWKTYSALSQWKGLASDMEWTHHGAEGHHKAALTALLEALLMAWLAQQKGVEDFVEDTMYLLIGESCSTFLTPYCCVLHCFSHTVSSDKKRDLCNRYTSEHHPCCGRNLASTFCS